MISPAHTDATRLVCCIAIAMLVPSLGATQIRADTDPGAHYCRGAKATILGTNQTETIEGTAGPDVIVGRGGDDLIKARGGDDRICGRRGSDWINAYRGDDRLFGGAGNDTLLGMAGSDLCDGGRPDHDSRHRGDVTDHSCENVRRAKVITFAD
jgi:hemolysin type calcium-binding protein